MNNVSINHPAANSGDLHRAIWLARKMKESGLWDGQARLVFRSPRILSQDVAESQLTGELYVTPGNFTIG